MDEPALQWHNQNASIWCFKMKNTLSKGIYTIAQVILAFLLVLTHELLEDRRMNDVISTKFFLLQLKMEERFEN